MRVYNSWTREEYIRNHVPQEFKATAAHLTAKQIEALSEAIDAYYHRVRRDTETRVVRGIVEPNRLG